MINIEDLKQYNLKTTKEGILCPTLEEFDNKIQMAINLWPQVDKNGNIEYLFGKGVGVELALRGQVKSREKNDINISYRSHSDFEIYGAKSNQYSELPSSNNFTYVFGSQEIFTKDHTKGLKNLPLDLMDNTYETVFYNNNIYLIPELELLFLDKYLKKENTPREEGYDAEVLLMQYKLDLNKVIDYFEKYYMIPNLEKLYKTKEELLPKQILGLIKEAKFQEMLLKEDGIEVPVDIITQLVNDKITQVRNQKIKSTIGGCAIEELCPDTVSFSVNQNGEYVVNNQEEISNLISQYIVNQELKYKQEIGKIIELFNSVYSNDSIKSK